MVTNGRLPWRLIIRGAGARARTSRTSRSERLSGVSARIRSSVAASIVVGGDWAVAALAQPANAVARRVTIAARPAATLAQEFDCGSGVKILNPPRRAARLTAPGEEPAGPFEIASIDDSMHGKKVPLL